MLILDIVFLYILLIKLPILRIRSISILIRKSYTNSDEAPKLSKSFGCNERHSYHYYSHLHHCDASHGILSCLLLHLFGLPILQSTPMRLLLPFLLAISVRGTATISRYQQGSWTLTLSEPIIRHCTITKK